MSTLTDQGFKRLFKASPGNIMVLRPDTLEIVAVTDEYLKVTMTRESDIVGRTLFEVFPGNPGEQAAEGVAELLDSLQRVQALKIPDVMGVVRYPILTPAGEFVERFWSPVNTPVLTEDGEIEFIMHRTEDITTIVREGSASDQARITASSEPAALQDVILRSRELRQALLQLQKYEARMRTAERLLSLGAWELNLATGRLSWSDQVFDIYGLARSQTSPGVEEYFALVHPEDRASSRAVYAAFAEQNAPQITFKHRVIARDGSVKYIQGMGERHVSSEGDVVVGYVQDITPLIKTRHQLTQAEHLVRLAGEKAQLGGWRIEVGSEATLWTPETAAIHGMPAGYSPSNVSEAIAFYAPEYRPQIRQAFDTCAQEGQPFDLVCQLQTPDGRRPWVRAIGNIQRDAKGRAIAVQGAFQDISTLHAAQVRAEKAERGRLNVLESISDAFYALDPDWNFSYLNQKAGDLLERSRDELLGRNVWEEFPEAVDTAIQHQYQWALQNQKTIRFDEYYPPLEKWFEISAYPIPEGLAVYFRDVTQRKHQDAELEQAQERFRLISMATNDVIWDWNLVTDKLWWNDSMTEVFGYTLSALEPGPEAWSLRIHADERERVLDSIHEAFDGNEKHWQSEYRFLKNDGQYANVIDRGFVIRDEAGKVVRAVGSMIDITERMQMEQRLRESQKMEAVGHLTGGVAHDFNNLLTVILGNAEMLAELSTDPNLRPMADMTLSAAQRGAELTSRLLAFARRQPLDPKATDLNQLAEAMQPLIRRTLPGNIELSFALDPDLGIAEIDASELDTALLNLVVNARDAMQGGGKLTVETANAVLDSDYSANHPEVAPGKYVMISVSDTGTGMTPETVRRAFEPFFTTKLIGKGSGLGLSMVFGFTKQSGGHLNIYSEVGEGTTVKLYFPAVEGVEQSSYRPAAEMPLVGGSEHILIAEDDDLVFEHLERQLRLLGYRVTATKSGPEALAALQANEDIDLLLTDIIMPGGMNGRQLADQAQALYPRLKVLFSSGYTENAIVHHGRLDPGVNLLSKPYTRLELSTKVRLVLDQPRP